MPCRQLGPDARSDYPHECAQSSVQPESASGALLCRCVFIQHVEPRDKSAALLTVQVPPPGIVQMMKHLLSHGNPSPEHPQKLVTGLC